MKGYLVKLSRVLLLPAILFALVITAFSQSAVLPDRLSPADFSRLVTQFSEPGGEFISDNLISNETGYVRVLDKLVELKAAGGAYIGVGPEQNFSYIARIKPRIAFVVDLRHLAVTQHLMYKAFFQLSEDRAGFISRLLSRPVAKEAKLSDAATIDELIEYFAKAKVDEKFCAANLSEVRRLITDEYKIPFGQREEEELEYLFSNFKSDGLEISFRLYRNWNYFPTLREIIIQKDKQGKGRHFLASKEEYNFLRQMQLRNLIIPVNGNFAGDKALASIGKYLKLYEVPVTAFYLSNVEQYLFGDQIFSSFAANVKKLPIDDKSLFIRSVFERYGTQTSYPGELFIMQLQRMSQFVKDFDQGKYLYYGQLISTNVIYP